MNGPTASEISSRLEFARDAALDAARIILGFYQNAGLNVERKRDASPVTIADRRAEQAIREGIAKHFPDDGVLGEEFGETPGTSGFRWVLDPLDGTKSFIHGTPLFGTLIGVEHLGRCVVGVCNFPVLNEMAWGSVGGGAWWQTGSEQAKPPRACRTWPNCRRLCCASRPCRDFRGSDGRMRSTRSCSPPGWFAGGGIATGTSSSRQDEPT